MARARKTSSTSASTEPWSVEFFQRHRDDDKQQAVPGMAYLDSIPPNVAGRFLASLAAVADAPPPLFSGGGLWEAMHDEMAGFYEVRIDHRQAHFRLFCILERDGADIGLDGPAIVVIDGRTKPFRTTLSKKEYAVVRALGDEYRARTPRSVLEA